MPIKVGVVPLIGWYDINNSLWVLSTELKNFYCKKKKSPQKCIVCLQPLQQRWLHKCIVSDLRNSVAIENSGGDKETCMTKTAVGASSETHGLTAHAEHPIQQMSGLWQCWFGCHTGTWGKDHTHIPILEQWKYFSQVIVISLSQGSAWLCYTRPPPMMNIWQHFIT